MFPEERDAYDKFSKCVVSGVGEKRVQILADLSNLEDPKMRRIYRKDQATKTHGAADAPLNAATHQMILEAFAPP